MFLMYVLRICFPWPDNAYFFWAGLFKLGTGATLFVYLDSVTSNHHENPVLQTALDHLSGVTYTLYGLLVTQMHTRWFLKWVKGKKLMVLFEMNKVTSEIYS